MKTIANFVRSQNDMMLTVVALTFVGNAIRAILFYVWLLT